MKNLFATAMFVAGAAVLMAACPQAQQQPSQYPQGQYPQGQAPQGQYMPGQGQRADDFYNSLSPAAKQKFDRLDDRQKDAVVDQVNRGTDPNKAIDSQLNQKSY